MMHLHVYTGEVNSIVRETKMGFGQVRMKNAHVGWLWAVAHTSLTGFGPGTLFAPLLVKYFGILGTLIIVACASILTLLGQIQLSLLFKKSYNARNVNELYDNAPKPLKYAEMGTGMLLKLIIAGISLMYLMVIAGQASSLYTLTFTEKARNIAMTVALVLADMVLFAIPRHWIDKASSWLPFLTICCTLPSLLLVWIYIFIQIKPSQLLTQLQNLFPIRNAARLPFGIGLALFFMGNYPSVGHILNRCPSNPRSIFIVPMYLFIIPLFLLTAIGGYLLFEETYVIDILTSSPHSWRLFASLRYLFGVDRFVAMIYLLHLMDMPFGKRRYIFINRLLICSLTGALAYILSPHLVSLMEWTGLALITINFLIMPAFLRLSMNSQFELPGSILVLVSILFSSTLILALLK